MWSKLYLVLINDLTQLGLQPPLTGTGIRFHNLWLMFELCMIIPLILSLSICWILQKSVWMTEEGRRALVIIFRVCCRRCCQIIWAICLGAQVGPCDTLGQSEARIVRLDQSEAGVGTDRCGRERKVEVWVKPSGLGLACPALPMYRLHQYLFPLKMFLKTWN